MMSEIFLSEILGPAFRDLAGDVLRHGHTHYDLSGGRGSLKSSTVSLLVPLILLQHPDAHALVLRKVAKTIRDSVYNQYIWALEKLGIAESMGDTVRWRSEGIDVPSPSVALRLGRVWLWMKYAVKSRKERENEAVF